MGKPGPGNDKRVRQAASTMENSMSEQQQHMDQIMAGSIAAQICSDTALEAATQIRKCVEANQIDVFGTSALLDAATKLLWSARRIKEAVDHLTIDGVRD